MKTYVNNGSKKGDKAYLVVKGKRVYTGEEFKATDKDIGKLEKDFNVKPKNQTKAAKSKQPDPVKDKSYESEKKTSLVESYKGSEDTKTTNSEEGVK
jgi:hypothetical protein